MKKLWGILCLLMLCQYSFPIYFKHLGMSEGLSQASVMSIYQDQLGRMWFGTREGISVYNGENMLVYKAWNNENSEEHIDVLYGNECDFLTGNKEGDVFFRTNGALMRYDIREESFHIVRSQNVRTLTSFKGDIWCVCSDSLFTYNALGDSLDFRMKTNVENTFTMLLVGNKLWLGTEKGLYLIEEGKNAEVIIPHLDIYSVFASSVGDIWVGTRMHGLFCLSPDGTQKRYTSGTDQKVAYSSSRIGYLKSISDRYPNKLALKKLFGQPLIRFSMIRYASL